MRREGRIMPDGTLQSGRPRVDLKPLGYVLLGTVLVVAGYAVLLEVISAAAPSTLRQWFRLTEPVVTFAAPLLPILDVVKETIGGSRTPSRVQLIQNVLVTGWVVAIAGTVLGL